MGNRFHKFTDEQITWLKRNRRLSHKGATALFNLKFGTELIVQQIVNARKRNQLKTGRTGRFKPGNAPSPLAGSKGPNRTSFKIGSVPPNRVPVGTEKMRGGYVYVKTESGRWRLKHRQIIAGDVVRFRDGDPLNVTVDNLIPLTRSEHLILNRTNYSKTPEPARNTHIVTAKLKAIIIEVRKK